MLSRARASASRKADAKADQQAQVAAVRSVVGVTAARYTDQQLLMLVRHVRAGGGDVGTACDALLMIPQPSWLAPAIGYRPYVIPK